MNPLVSIIIPLYNAENYIAETLRSVLNQTWKNKEIIIVNDGSTDNSLAVVKSFDFEEIIVINQKNQGASAAKQTGLNRANGQFIQYLDADDILAPDKIEIQLMAIFDQPNKLAICQTAHFFDTPDNNIPGDNYFFTEYLDEPLNFLIKLYGGFERRGGMIQPNAFLTPINVIEKAGPWNTSISPCPDEDGEYFSRIILASSGIICQPGILNFYRKFHHQRSLSGQLNEKKCLNLVKGIWIKHQNLLRYATTKEQVTGIHNATYRALHELQINTYFKFKELRLVISNYLNQLKPNLKPDNFVLGGSVINIISKTLGWKTAKWLQHHIQP